MSVCLACQKKRSHLDHSRGVCRYEKPPGAFATKPRKRVNPRSAVMKAFYTEERIPLVKAVLIRDSWNCRIKAPGCTVRATTVHEVKTRGRFGGIRAPGVNTLENAYAACERCNGYVSEHAVWAKENGWLASSTGRGDLPRTPTSSGATALSEFTPVAGGADNP